jgi:phosphate transport system substrate-binding protein
MKETTLSTRRIGALALSIAAALAVAACGSSSSSSTSSSASSTAAAGSGSGSSSGKGTINGAGSTFAAPIYNQWGQNLSSQGLTVNYNPLGSGAGIAGLQSATVDFAGSDPPMKSTEVKAARGPVLQFPIAFGAITVSYNLAGVKAGLKLDGKTIADIFLGKVKKWNDPEIASLNSGVKLPSTSITVVHRSDSSGTTQGFTTFLAAYSPQWVSTVGKPAKTAKWPTGTGAPKNAGVASAIKQTPGAIGYVEQAYALQNGFTYASVKNKSGTFVLPTLQAASAAAEGIKVPSDLAVTTINSPNAAAYPITSQTFLIAYKDMCKAGRSQSAAASVKKFITYGLGAGQKVEESLDFAPLPSSLLSKAQAQVNQLECNGSPVS